MSPLKRGESSDMDRLLTLLNDTADDGHVVNAVTADEATKSASDRVRENCIVLYVADLLLPPFSM